MTTLARRLRGSGEIAIDVDENRTRYASCDVGFAPIPTVEIPPDVGEHHVR